MEQAKRTLDQHLAKAEAQNEQLTQKVMFAEQRLTDELNEASELKMQLEKSQSRYQALLDQQHHSAQTIEALTIAITKLQNTVQLQSKPKLKAKKKK